MKKLLLAVGLVLAATQVWAADAYTIDPVHSTLGFSIKHMMVSQTSGQFNQYEGVIVYDPNNLANSSANVTIQAASIDTRNEKRDGHLKSPDFFDAAKFPTITFVSKKFSKDSIVGDLTIKGVTKEVTIPMTVSGPVTSMMGSPIIGLSGTLTLNRQDYGITWNKALDQGGVAVANDVQVTINIEAGKK